MSAESADPLPALVDVHSHFVTDAYVAAAREAGHEHPDGMPGWPSWSAADQLQLMDRAGIATSVLSISSPGTHFGDDRAARRLSREVNEFAAEVRTDHPSRFGHFASVPLPDIDGALTEAAYALDVLGADGITLESNVHGSYLGDRRFTPLWSELDRRGTVVFVHPTSPPNAETLALGRPRPLIEFIFDSARTAADLVFSGVVTEHRRIEWIFTHGGGALPLLAERMDLFRAAFALQDGHAHGASAREQLAGFWYDLAGTPFPDQAPALERAFGTGRLLYGSDSCWTPAAAVLAQVASIERAGASGDGTTWRELTTRNAQRLLRRGSSL
jgi:6-methylsalicylate decarboxylase